MTEHILYGGDVKLLFDEARHQYRIGDKLCPSVTGILDIINKPALMGWAVKMCAEYLEDNLEIGKPIDELIKMRLIKEMKSAHRRKSGDAADIGSIVHQFAEDYVQGKDPALPVNKEARQAAESFLDWMSQHHVKILASERRIFSRKHYYAGTMDLEAEVDGALTRADFKTSNGIYPEMFLQLAGYDLARAEEVWACAKIPASQLYRTDIYRAERRTIIRFPKEGGSCQVQDAIKPAEDDAGFLAALALFRWQKGVAA